MIQSRIVTCGFSQCVIKKLVNEVKINVALNTEHHCLIGPSEV